MSPNMCVIVTLFPDVAAMCVLFDNAVNTRIKETGFLHLGSEFLDNVKRIGCLGKDIFCIFEVSGFILT